jgi:hypothetical protein
LQLGGSGFDGEQSRHLHIASDARQDVTQQSVFIRFSARFLGSLRKNSARFASSAASKPRADVPFISRAISVRWSRQKKSSGEKLKIHSEPVKISAP